MSLPIDEQQAAKASQWLKTNYGNELFTAVQNTPFSIDNLCGIACQETAYFWLPLLDKLTPGEICARCVLDGSGDFKPEENPRDAFPQNTAAFRDRYDATDPGFADMLIAEGNETRRVRGLSPVDWLYKGYGIFQYDLQFVEDDPAFFRDKLWYRFDECLKRAMMELKGKFESFGDVRTAIRAYNGRGARAENYATNVMAFSGIAANVAAIAQAAGPDTPEPGAAQPA
jgi:hypothetical protein